MRHDEKNGKPAWMPAAYVDALSGGRGWGLTRADGLVALLAGVLAVAVCCALWFGYGVEGVPGLGAGQEDPAGAGGPASSRIEVDGGSLGISGVGAADAGGLLAVVQNGAGYVEVLPLGTDAQVTVEGELGTNVIEVRGGSVRCMESDCDNQVCVNTGWVGAAGQMIVCLPHQLTVQVVRNAEDAAPLV